MFAYTLLGKTFFGLHKKFILFMFRDVGLRIPLGDINWRGVRHLPFGVTTFTSYLLSWTISMFNKGFTNLSFPFFITPEFSCIYDWETKLLDTMLLPLIPCPESVSISWECTNPCPFGWMFSILLLLKISMIFSSLVLLKIISLCIMSIFCSSFNIFLKGSDYLSQNFMMFYFWGASFRFKIYLSFCSSSDSFCSFSFFSYDYSSINVREDRRRADEPEWILF